MTHHRRRKHPIAATVAAVAALLGAIASGPAPVDAQEPVVVIEGYGWGHGRGMGQYGALGYAVDHGWGWRQILGHYYSNTAEGTVPASTSITTRLTAVAGGDTIVWRPAGGLQTDATGGHQAAAFLVRLVSGGRYEVYSGPGCAGPWTGITTATADVVRVSAVVDASTSADANQLLGLCQAGGVRFYRGQLHAYRDGANQNQTRNEVNLEQYLRGVVPRESPASWGSVGGGRGLEALRAQAVAARSYALGENRDPGRAKTCDTTSCQVYSGAFWLPNGGSLQAMEHSLSDQAVASTAGIIRTLNGAPARTEFSSSTGGWTAGGTFPAVIDDGDDYSGNRLHTWTEAVRTAAIEAAYPTIGRLTSLEVIQRSGLGRAGGRVVNLRLHGTAGATTVTGSDFRSRLSADSACTKVGTGHLPQCMKSDWFQVVSGPTGDLPVPDTVGMAVAPNGARWLVTGSGRVVPRNGGTSHGSADGSPLNARVLDLAAHAGGSGYWVVASDGGVFAYGHAGFHGSTGAMRLNKPVVGMGAGPSGGGYWLVASDGGIFAFGDARFHGSTGAMRLNQPVVGMASTPTGGGYWLVASDGGIFAFGDAGFHGSAGAIRLAQPVIGMAATKTGRGYWLLARDGGVFAYGDAAFHGAMPGRSYGGTVVDIEATPTGGGYWIVTSDGTAHPFGDAATT